MDGKQFTCSLQDALAKGPTVVYFYPSAYTQGCNVQAQPLAIYVEKFDAAGTIIGSCDLEVRAGSADARDTRGVTIGHGLADRTTFIIGTDGKMVAMVGGMSPADNVLESLKLVEAMAAR